MTQLQKQAEMLKIVMGETFFDWNGMVNTYLANKQQELKETADDSNESKRVDDIELRLNPNAG